MLQSNMSHSRRKEDVVRQVQVRELFLLLHQLGITQQVVANRLKVARASVAMWAGGKRAVPQRHALDFFNFVAAAIETACANAWAENRDTGGTLLSEGSTAKRFEREIHTRLDRWELEIYKTTGRLDQEYQQHANTLLLYLHQPPSKLSREERDQVRTAAHGLARAIRALAHYHNRPEETEGRILGSLQSDLSPLARFWELAAWGIEGQQGEDEELNEEESGP
jgi:transcriptional regulator with XRE-family HTH domain